MGREGGLITQHLSTDEMKTRRKRRRVELNKQRCMARHEELHRRKSYGQEIWRVNKVCQETLMITK